MNTYPCIQSPISILSIARIKGDAAKEPITTGESMPAIIAKAAEKTGRPRGDFEVPKQPQYGMKGSKPRAGSPSLEPEPPTPAMSSPPTGPPSAAEEARARFEVNARLDREYKEKRNRKLSVELMHKEMELAVARDELIPKELVLKQLSYINVAMRQKFLSLPSKIGNHFGDRKVPIREVADYLRGQVNETLKELSKLPDCVETDWMERLEEED